MSSGSVIGVLWRYSTLGFARMPSGTMTDVQNVAPCARRQRASAARPHASETTEITTPTTPVRYAQSQLHRHAD